MAMNRRRFLAASAATSVSLGLAAGCSRTRRVRPEDARAIAGVYPPVSSRDGAGVKLRRALGHRELPMLDPFLLLDEIHSDDPADYRSGFPEHPHRGFETVSYLIRGNFEHADSVGNRGTIGPGDCQWMTAGRGIIHAEMPTAAAGDPELWGLQLWVNLPAADKMRPPRYQDTPASAIPELELGDGRVRVVAGRIGRAVGPIDGIAVGPTLIDVALPAGGSFAHDLPEADNCFAFMLSGSAELGADARTVRDGELAVTGRGRRFVARSHDGGRFLLIAARPIGEPVARRGPFVMNTADELRQAFADYRNGTLVGD